MTFHFSYRQSAAEPVIEHSPIMPNESLSPAAGSVGIARKVISAGMKFWAAYLLIDLGLALLLGIRGLPSFGLTTITLAAFHPQLLADSGASGPSFLAWIAVMAAGFILLAWLGWRRSSRVLAWCFVSATLISTVVAVGRAFLSFAGIKC